MISGNIMWPRDDRFILSYAKFVGYLDTKGSNPIYVAYDLDGQNGRQLTIPQRTWYTILSMLPSDPEKILVSKSHWADEIMAKKIILVVSLKVLSQSLQTRRAIHALVLPTKNQMMMN